MGNFETLLYEEREGVAVVTLNRPEVLNAFNQQMQDEMRELWRSLRTNEGVRAVVLTGAGEKAFSTGIDRIESIEETYLPRAKDKKSKAGRVSTPFMYNDPGSDLNPKANDLWKPVVAAVNGMACGGALYMLGEADIIIAAEHATFFDPHVTYGMVTGFEATHLLQKLPLGETLRVALLGAHERLSAARAYQLGLVSEVVPAGELMEKALWVAEAIASAPVLAVQGTLRAIWMAHELSRSAALAQVSTLVSLGTQYENMEKGQGTFKADRPRWRLR
ncbi:MAG TPA: enoyl-CoA hydratase/isomerase family protein [Acidimicrobiales bacterium]|nr:enoyl-CoA hydratase/isomerase family protein [Acidimicrobiales bacterium]